MLEERSVTRKAPAEMKPNNGGGELLDDEMQAAVTKRCHGTAAGERKRRGMSGRKRGRSAAQRKTDTLMQKLR